MLDVFENTLSVQSQLVGADDKRMHMETLANVCNVLTSIIRRISKQIAPLADRIMQLLLTVMASANKASTLLEDAFLAVSALATAMEGDFVRYMESFSPFLFSALQNHEEHAV